MFLKLDGTVKAISLVAVGSLVVVFAALSNNAYASSSVNRFIGSNSLVQYSEDPELEEAPISDLSTEEDIRIYAESKGCSFVSSGVQVNEVVEGIKNKILYNCRGGKLIKLETNEIPKPKSNEFYDPKTGQIRRLCSGWESIRRFFGGRLKCAYLSEKRKADKDPASYLEYFKRKGTYHFIVQSPE
ncbi:hypothetical protein HF1_00890 [Mycoplasma haemofelis str. Langford 1]|uniref:Uncharacterized protein n=1 Tax=Mycoplasma haemofelis (strain Langford 1) TaxID=941640 RepID=E8ZKD1_MYCHL|nr:hypothetical protein [Mycoplasma haemofelis]CBY92097.1 hypothetical protein HF1_00890 [Mycoplasma haemofelis str. Langford 1]